MGARSTPVIGAHATPVIAAHTTPVIAAHPTLVIPAHPTLVIPAHPTLVIPAQAGIQGSATSFNALDSRLRGNDEGGADGEGRGAHHGLRNNEAPASAGSRAATMVDVAFALRGTTLPRDHRRLLADSVQRVLPWFGGAPGTGLHRLNVARGDTGCDLLSRRTRLVLRVPRERAADAAALAGAEFDLGGHRVTLGSPQPRELLAYGTLYAHLVASDAADEGAFLAWLDGELKALGISARAICGRWQSVESHALAGCSLMLDGLGREASLRVLERGVGPHRRLGCGLFVPHKSAAAVGAPD